MSLKAASIPSGSSCEQPSWHVRVVYKKSESKGKNENNRMNGYEF